MHERRRSRLVAVTLGIVVILALALGSTALADAPLAAEAAAECPEEGEDELFVVATGAVPSPSARTRIAARAVPLRHLPPGPPPVPPPER